MFGKLFASSGARGELGQALTLGLNFATGMAVFCCLGLWADHRRGGGILFTLLGMALGLAYGAYEVWKVIRLLNAQAEAAMRARAARPPTAPARAEGEGAAPDSEDS